MASKKRRASTSRPQGVEPIWDSTRFTLEVAWHRYQNNIHLWNIFMERNMELAYTQYDKFLEEALAQEAHLTAGEKHWCGTCEWILCKYLWPRRRLAQAMQSAREAHPVRRLDVEHLSGDTDSPSGGSGTPFSLNSSTCIPTIRPLRQSCVRREANLC